MIQENQTVTVSNGTATKTYRREIKMFYCLYIIFCSPKSSWICSTTAHIRIFCFFFNPAVSISYTSFRDSRLKNVSAYWHFSAYVLLSHFSVNIVLIIQLELSCRLELGRAVWFSILFSQSPSWNKAFGCFCWEVLSCQIGGLSTPRCLLVKMLMNFWYDYCLSSLF